MRKILALVMILSLMLASGCVPAPTAPVSGKPQVVTTIFPPYDFARQIAGDLCDVSMLIRPGVDSHAFEPSPQDILKIQSANVFICMGGVDEAWVDRVLAAMNTKPKVVLELMDTVLDEPQTASEPTGGASAESHDEGEHVHGDEHIWLNPAYAQTMVLDIASALGAADPAREPQYMEAARNYNDRVIELDARMREMVRGAARTEIVVGDRFPFAHFTEYYGLTAYAAYAGCGEDAEPSAQMVASLIERVKDDHIPVVYQIEQSSGKVARAIAEASGARVLTLYSCHNLSKAERDAGETYLSLMEKNLEALKEGLD